MLRNWSVGTRLALGFVMMIVAMLTMVIVGLGQMQGINDNLVRIVEVNNVKKDKANLLRNRVDSQAILLRDGIVLQGDMRKQIIEKIAEGRKNGVEETQALAGLLKGAGSQSIELEQMERIGKASQETGPFIAKLVELLRENHEFDENEKLQVVQTLEQQGKIREAINGLLQIEDDLNQKSVLEAQESYQTARNTSFLAIILACIFSLPAAVVITRSIVRPVNQVLKEVEEMADGDMVVDVKPEGSDEISRLLRGVKSTCEALSIAIGQVRSNSQGVAHTSSALNSAATHVKSSTEVQSESAAAMASALEEMSTSISHVSDLARDARTLALAASTGATEGARQIESMVQEISRISSTIEESAKYAQSLESESERIGGVVNVIKGVADQTNLLALNAAIEAARAGEMGRGFAVVADEVRKLAERSATSAQEITGMVSAIQGRSGNMLQWMENAVTQMKGGLGMAENAGQLVWNIDADAQKVTAVIDDVSTALQEQATASHDLANSVEKIVQMAEENSQAVAQVADAADRLEHMSDELLQSVSRFRLSKS